MNGGWASSCEDNELSNRGFEEIRFVNCVTCPWINVPVPSVDEDIASPDLLLGEVPGEPGCVIQLLLHLRNIKPGRNDININIHIIS